MNLRLAYALGGGIGHTGEGWCGALVGGAMAVGELYAERVADPLAVAPATWPVVQELYHGFVAEYGPADCRSQLGFSIESPEGFAHYPETSSKEDVCFRNLLFVLRRLLPLGDQIARDEK